MLQHCRIEDGQQLLTQGTRSYCTLFEDIPENQPGHACHCHKDTEIDNASFLFNGDIVGGSEASLVRKHHLQGGSVRNHSKFVNGDLDRDTFLAFFCQQ